MQTSSMGADLARPAARPRRELSWLGLPLALAAVLGLWQALATLGGYRAFILPSPALVWERFVATAQSGLLWQHTRATLVEALGGFAIALVVALTLGYILAHIPWLERALAPVLAAGQV